MATRQRPTSPKHILLLGASGISGLAFIQEYLNLPSENDNKPFLTLYVRASGRSKLTPVLSSAATNDKPAAKIRIIEGDLGDKSAIRAALSADGSFPKVTTVISVLGAYMRSTNTIIPALLEMDIKHVLLLSTPAAFPIFRETAQQSWNWYWFSWHPVLVVPAGHAEMKGIAHAIMDNSSGQLKAKHGLEATVFRIPYLNDGKPELDVRAFTIGGEGNTECKDLSRGSMARWLLREVEEKQWVGRAPTLCNPTV